MIKHFPHNINNGTNRSRVITLRQASPARESGLACQLGSSSTTLLERQAIEKQKGTHIKGMISREKCQAGVELESLSRVPCTGERGGGNAGGKQRVWRSVCGMSPGADNLGAACNSLSSLSCLLVSSALAMEHQLSHEYKNSTRERPCKGTNNKSQLF
ncbi:hypothetical protein BaRGS_00028820, partial [Batillaria attramentaria]